MWVARRDIDIGDHHVYHSSPTENKSPAEGLPLAEKSPKLQCAESLVTEPPLHQKPLLPG